MNMKTIIRSLVCTVWLVLLLSPSVTIADENRPIDNPDPPPVVYELDAIVVSASKIKEPIEDISRHVTVITADDIRESAAKNIIDVLAREVGISVRSASGNDRQAVVDLRGMGDTAASNVVVMVDDVRINASDQSGPSLSSIPIEQIERIEIVRGAGSVVYGSGAVGGVVHVITKKAGAILPGAQIYAGYGGDDTWDTRASLGGSVKDIFFNVDTGIHDSEGYRDNGFFRKKDIRAGSGYALNERLSFNLSGAYYEDEYGLPGPVSRDDIGSRSCRTGTDSPDDTGESSEFRGRGEMDMDFGRWGTVNLKRGYVCRDNQYIIGFSPQILRADQKDKIDEDIRQLDINYVKNYMVAGLSHMFQMGADHFKTEYIREERPDGPRKNSETESFGIFVNNRWTITEQVTINAGARDNTYDGRFRTDARKLFDGKKLWVNGNADKSEWDNSAYSVGLTWDLTPDTSFWGSWATSFRIPNVDEFAESEEGLRPQEGVHMEIGGRRHFGDFMTLALSLFDIRVDDEIYYSDINRNYDDKTVRQGIETDVSVNLTDTIRLWANYTYMQAEFDKKNTTIPLVPEHLASSGVLWKPMPAVVFALSGTYTGSRYDGNDTENNRYVKLDDFIVFDTKLSYEIGDFTTFIGIHNIFNELYETSAYSEQYYPMPERTIYGGIRWTCF